MSVSFLGRFVRRAPRATFGVVTGIGLASVLGLVFAGCGSTKSETTAATAALPERPIFTDAGTLAGLENFHKWSEKITAGGQPMGEVAFQNLAVLGYRTIVSVDGLKPDVETAQKYGIRYIHVPFGYDGVPRDAQVKIVKAVVSADGPVFIHCHHGVARGPAGAVIARIAVDGITNEEAAKELKDSGCDPRYKGLYRDVSAAVAPSLEELAKVSADLPSFVSQGTLADQMAVLDRTWARVGWAKSATWAASKEHPDVDPASEARILWERFRELARLGDLEKHGPDFLANLQKAEDGGHALEDALLKGDRDAATKSFAAIKQTCDSCHARWRD